MSRARGIRLGRRQRLLVYCSVILAVVSGIAWIGLGLALDPQDFSDPLRVWRHRTLALHGVSAYVLLWTAGTLFPQHQRGAWLARRNRVSGGLLSGLLLALALGGLALYYPPDENWRDAFSLSHQAMGVALALLLPLHVRAGREKPCLAIPRSQRATARSECGLSAHAERTTAGPPGGSAGTRGARINLLARSSIQSTIRSHSANIDGTICRPCSESPAANAQSTRRSEPSARRY